MSIDLHTHSTVSDGTQSPSQVIASAAAAGLDVVALTDHDSVAGWTEAADAAHAHGITLVRGAELSVVYDGMSVHLLAYLFDPNDEELAHQMRQVRQARLTRGEQMAQRISRDYPLTWEDVLNEAGDAATVGRPHIADALVTAGVVNSRDEAFASLLMPHSKYYVPHYSISARDAVTLVRRAGGVPVIAHPGADTRGRVLDYASMKELVKLGLAGLEVDHRDHSADTRARLGEWAKQLNILATGSSDYHGAGKENRLGENTTPQPVFDAIVAQSSGVELL
ncbi:hypothetical protein SAMN06309944_0765 [Micrococcales bacterium KH10]|nr:hypothetical protein SAMN06309944_0765 [Micrococcales bacterium KH10]